MTKFHITPISLHFYHQSQSKTVSANLRSEQSLFKQKRKHL